MKVKMSSFLLLLSLEMQEVQLKLFLEHQSPPSPTDGTSALGVLPAHLSASGRPGSSNDPPGIEQAMKQITHFLVAPEDDLDDDEDPSEGDEEEYDDGYNRRRRARGKGVERFEVEQEEAKEEDDQEEAKENQCMSGSQEDRKNEGSTEGEAGRGGRYWRVIGRRR